MTTDDLTRSSERRADQSFLSTNSPWLHFGLGDGESPDAPGTADPGDAALLKANIKVRWPGAAPKTYGPFDLDQHVVIEE